MKAGGTSPSSSSYSFGYAALDWCCDDGRGTASLLADGKPLQESEKRGKSKFFRRRGVDSNSSASTASTQDDLSTEPLMTPVDPIWDPHSFAAEVPNVHSKEITRDIPPTPMPVERSESELAERAMGPIDLDDLEEVVVAPSNSQEDSTLGSLNTNAIPSLGSLDSTPETTEEKASASAEPEELPATAVVETEPLAAATVPESPTDLLESSHVVEDPLLLLLVSQGPERSEKRDPTQLDTLLQNILQDDEVTLASSAASTAVLPPSGDLMDALAAGPVDVDDFIPEDSYWSMNTQDFILDEVDVSRQLAGYHEGCEPPCIDHVDYTIPSSPPRSMTRQRTAATAETTELLRRAHAMRDLPLRRPDVVRRHVTTPTTRPTVPHSVRPTATHPGSVGRPSVRHTATRYTVSSVRPSSGRPSGGSVRPNGGSVRPTGTSVATRPSTQNSGAVRRPHSPHHVPTSPQALHSPSRAHSPPSVLRKERRWLPESAAEV